MSSSRFHGGRLLWLALLGVACGGSGGQPGGDGPQGPPEANPQFFDACGGRIVDPKTGAIDAAEYGRQARAWSAAILDCRLGPRFTDAFPGQDDPRPRLFQPPKRPSPVPVSAHLDMYQLGEYNPQ